MAQRAPRFAIRYEDTHLFQLALQRAGGDIDLVDHEGIQKERETSTLSAAKSIKRALARRGQCVHGIYERIDIHESWEWHSHEPPATARGLAPGRVPMQ